MKPQNIIYYFLLLSSWCFAQQNALASFDFPSNSALKFNKFLINPTYSFVREDFSAINFFNKRQWITFQNAPQTNFINYSGKIAENSGIGVGLYQQSVGVFTNFGALANYAQNVQLNSDANLTFGFNTVYYNSAFNFGKIVTTQSEPIIETVDSSALIAFSPGINYGNAFLDFGLSATNLVLYNLAAGEIVKDDPSKSYNLHLMYTGYINTWNGVFEETKFTTLAKVEKRKDDLNYGLQAQISAPRAGWLQAGYTKLYGISAGLGIQLTKRLAMGYSFEKGLGNKTQLGASHDVTIAYIFKNYDNDDYFAPAVVKAKENTISKAELKLLKAKNDSIASQQKIKLKQQRIEADIMLQKAAEAKAREEALAKEKAATEAKAREETLAKEKVAAEAKAREEALAKEKAVAAAKAKEEALAREKAVVEAKTREEALAKEKAAAEAKAREEALAKEKAAAEAKAREEALAKEKAAAEAKAREEALAKERAAAEAKAREEALAKERAAAEAKAREEALAKERAAAEAKAKEEATKNVPKEVSDQTEIVKDLIRELDEIVIQRNKELQNIKDENNLGKDFKPTDNGFFSMAESNRKLEAVKANIDISINDIDALLKNWQAKQNLPEAKSIIENLQQKRAQILKTRTELFQQIEAIKAEREIEIRKRIKKADYDSEADRLNQDQKALEALLNNAGQLNTNIPVNVESKTGSNSNDIAIIKKITDVESGFYVVLGTFNSTQSRDTFVSAVIQSGQTNVKFFYNIHNSQYYVYIAKEEDLEQATKALEQERTTKLGAKASLVKVEN